MLTKFKRKSVVVIMMGSYITIILSFIIMMVYFYSVTLSAINNKLETQNEASFEKFIKNIDSCFETSEMLLKRLSWDSEVKRLMSENDIFRSDALRLESYVKVIGNMNAWKLFNPFIKTVFMYNKYDNVIASNDGKYELGNFYKYNFQKYVSYNEFLNIFKETHTMDYRIVRNLGVLNDGMVIIFQTIPLDTTGNNSGCIGIVVDLESISKKFESLKWHDLGALAISLNDQVFASNKGNFNNDIKDNEYVVDKQKSDVTPFEFVAAMPKSIFFKEISNMRMFLLLLLMVFIVLSLTVAYKVFQFNYSGIRNILRLLPKNPNAANEFETINSSITTMIVNAITANDELEKQRITLRDYFLFKLLKGEFVDVNYINAELEKHNLFFIKDKIYVLVTEYAQNELESEDIHSEINDTIKNLVSDYIISNHNGYIIEIEQYIVCIINVDSESEMVQNIRNMANVANQDYGLNLVVSISSPAKSISEVASLYRNARDVLEYRNIIGKGNVIYFEDVEKYGNDANRILIEIKNKEKMVENSLKAKDYNQARELIDSVCKIMFSGELSKEMFKLIKYSIINLLLDNFNDDYFNKITDLSKPKNAKQFMQDIFIILSEVENQKINFEKENLDDIVSKIVDFIQSNYNNKDLSVSMVADKFNMSSVQATRILKKRCGYSLLEYINVNRISEAKKLLVKENLTVNIIANMVGYDHPLTFIRIFKRYEGITPGQYKKI